MKSSVVKRSIALAGHKTSVSLEDAFWAALKTISAGLGMTLSDLIETIDAQREHANLSSAIRLFVLEFYRDQFMARMGVEDLAANPTLAPDRDDVKSDMECRPRAQTVA
jgi:predicted DNA-binding ribbon-helix-helix protein